MSEMLLYHMHSCPFCRSFAEDFRSLVKDGKEVMLADYDPRWRSLGIDYVPTVIEYEGDRELRRIQARPMVGISRKEFEEWLKDA